MSLSLWIKILDAASITLFAILFAVVVDLGERWKKGKSVSPVVVMMLTAGAVVTWFVLPILHNRQTDNFVGECVQRSGLPVVNRYERPGCLTEGFRYTARGTDGKTRVFTINMSEGKTGS